MGMRQYRSSCTNILSHASGFMQTLSLAVFLSHLFAREDVAG